MVFIQKMLWWRYHHNHLHHSTNTKVMVVVKLSLCEEFFDTNLKILTPAPNVVHVTNMRYVISSPLHQGQLGPMVGFPSMWLEIYPVRMDFEPLDGNPSSGWKFHQGLVGFLTICPKMAGWKSNHPLAKARPETSRSFKIPQCKVVQWELIWASLIC